jgi:enoyl-CoA hydratase/carnithine racemase
MREGRLLCEELGEGVRQLTLANAGRRNVLTASLLEALKEAYSNASGVRAWLLRGEGEKALSAGYDIGALRHYAPGEPLPDERVNEALCAIEAHPAPSIALVQGFAYGAGMELAAACDFRVGSAAAAFCMPPVRLGLIYPLSGITRIANLVGMRRARWMFLTGEVISGEEALGWGLLDRLEETPEAAEAYARGLCRRLAAGAPLALEGLRASLRAQGAGAEVLEGLREARRMAYNSEDAREGRAAFLEKRRPHFKGR